MRRATAWLLAPLLGAACARPELPPLPPAPHPLARVGPDRHDPDPLDTRLALRQLLVERINRDRAAHGVAPVAYDPLGSRIGDAFCLDAALTGVTGHYDVRGQAPYVRWGRGGGVDFHVQNASSYSVDSGTPDRPLEQVALEAHARMMAELPPADGHRRTILDPELTHVGIGLASVAGELRMTQEFSRVGMEWVALPARPLRPGATVLFAGKPLPGLAIGLVEVRHEPPPPPLARDDPRRTSSYGYPAVVQRLWPRPPQGFAFTGGPRPDFELRRDGSFFVQLPLDSGAGHYVLVAYVRRGPGLSDELRPVTAALVEARP